MPRTLAQNAQYIAETIKPAIKTAIEAQGVTVPSTDSFLDYADRIGEIEGGGSGYQLKDLPTGAISTVSDAEPLPLNALTVSVEAWQEGSGDPSPSNIRPISGWDSANINVGNADFYNSAGTTGNGTGQNIEIKSTNSFRVYCTVSRTYVSSNQPLSNYNLIDGKKYGLSAKLKEATGDYDGIISIRNSSNQIMLIAKYSNIGETKAIEFTYNASEMAAYYISFFATFDIREVASVTYSDIKLFEITNTYTLDFPTTIYGAEWNVVSGELKQTDGYIASYNGETLPSTWISDRDVYASGTTPTIGAEVVYKLATHTTIPQQPLSIRMLEGTNNLYADCGEVLEGEYFIDEGAIDVRKVDYQIGSSGSIKTTDGRVLSGFASMNGYHARPLDASGNWLDVDWSKDFEVCIAFKYTDSGASGITVLLGYNYSSTLNNRFQSPLIYIDKDHSRDLCLEISSNGSSWMVDQSLSYAISLDTWYVLKLKFTLSTLTLECSISTDLSTWTNLLSTVLSSAPYHNNTSMIGIGGGCQASSWSSNGLLIDTFNTYIKGDGVNWGASSGVFPN